ncbi:hypothetical protein [Mycobacterium interjectum]|uniref:hypothetical protein n=1 Tax=Mycobacterium interjectum TaxID=33895 RepID=UPI000B00E250|nr:hypothetical protein [Mycobacterium interjectum]MCV7092641.1 hypothetical protein [Mycobacterium interjectum]
MAWLAGSTRCDDRSLPLSSPHGYRSPWVIGDLGAALTLLAIAVPEQLAAGIVIPS